MIRKYIAAGLVAAGVALAPFAAGAQEFTFKLHQFLPLKSSVPAEFLQPWIEKIEKIRCFMRQDVTPKDSDEVLLSIREEQLIVSLSRRRPRKAPPEFIQMVSDYMETA